MEIDSKSDEQIDFKELMEWLTKNNIMQKK